MGRLRSEIKHVMLKGKKVLAKSKLPSNESTSKAPETTTTQEKFSSAKPSSFLKGDLKLTDPHGSDTTLDTASTKRSVQLNYGLRYGGQSSPRVKPILFHQVKFHADVQLGKDEVLELSNLLQEVQKVATKIAVIASESGKPQRNDQENAMICCAIRELMRKDWASLQSIFQISPGPNVSEYLYLLRAEEQILVH
ncbi:hypothetical protein M501DRAFT_986874 [Patellaria atrata CBS 101060]|uniref:Uncharacterized protein n=1 Tax=Patellaria atrata CBS 101060 TaxID=1346257 RepID=A0A9P4VR13_9PEZI|nr:hypothetical protein M501DRAFT_986874 [Patellaria atrata CBS 101060]